MCKFCEASSKEVLVNKRSRKGKQYQDYETELVNPSWNEAKWTYCDSYTEKYEEGTIMDVVFNSKTNKIEFSYSAYSCDSSFDSKLKINYCPFCGRELTNKEK
jgi:hypothetical protein